MIELMIVPASEPIDLAMRLLKAYKRRRHSRRREPANIFAIEDHSKAKPVPKLIWGDPRGDKGHLDLRLKRSFRPEEIENVKGLGNSAWEKHGEKIWNTPKIRKRLMGGGQLAMITHSFDPPIMDISGHGASAAPLMSHHILRLTGRMGDDGEPTLAVTTTHPATNMNAIKNKYDYIIDASDPEMPFDKGYGGFFQTGEPMDIAMRLLKQEDTLDFTCPQCGGQGGFYEGPFDGEGGTDYDYITCITCKGDGTIEPTHHPGQDNQGAVGATVFDTRDEQHRQEYDVENAMPYGNTVVAHGDGYGKISDPYRVGFSRDGRMKQTAHPIAPQEIIESEHPALRHRLPTIYTREWDGRPTNRGLNITGRGGSDFKRGEPMDIAMRLLKGKFDLIPMEAANELLAFSDDPTIIRWHNDKYGLGLSEEGLSQDEIGELHSHIIDSDTAFDPLVLGGISHAENVEQYEQESGKQARPMGLNIQLGDVPIIDPTKPETWKDGPGTTWVGGKPTVSPQITQQPFPYDFDYIHQGEPMDIAMQLLKHAKSPEALANKRKYDTNYHSTPDRVKYRQGLNQERRKRGVYGKGGKDMSHTKDGKLVAEDASKNRARHFKNRGTLKSVKILRSS